jgi:hypothetical protein
MDLLADHSSIDLTTVVRLGSMTKSL